MATLQCDTPGSAVQRRHAQAAHPASTGHRVVTGLIAVAGGVTLSIVSAHMGQDAISVAIAMVACFALAVGLLGPLLIQLAAATVGTLLRLTGVAGRLAVANTATAARRLSGVLVSLVLAVALGGSLWFVFTSEEHAASEQARVGIVANYVVTPPASGLPASTAATARAVPGVAAATGVLRRAPTETVCRCCAQRLRIPHPGRASCLPTTTECSCAPT